MSAAQTQPICEAGVTAQTLSAWRDDALPPDEAGRLMAHCAGCAACRARLARYSELAETLRTQPQPGPDGRLVAAVRARLTAQPKRATTLLLVARVARGRRLWSGLGALAAALLLVAGFAQLFRMTVARPTAPASTPDMRFAATWRAATFPAGFVVPVPANQSLATRSLDVAPSAGNTAYACMVPAQGQRTQPVIWVTHDRAAHWSERAHVPVVGEATNCLITVDYVDPSVAVADVLEANATDELFITFDGAATWQPLAGTGLTELGETATLSGHTYALAQGPSPSSSVAQTRLVVTTDHFVSMHTIDGAIAGQAGTDAYWVNPANGALLARTESGLWQTGDGGATWARMALPTGVSAPQGLVTVAVQAPARNEPWRLCLDESHPTGSPAYGPDTNSLYCTTDGGRTWGAPRSGQPTSDPLIAKLDGMALAADGAVLAVVPTSVKDTANPVRTFDLVRLPAGSNSWQNLGAVPALNVVYAPAPGRGVLWAVGCPELAMRSSGSLANAGYSADAGFSAYPAIFAATYG